MRADAVIIGAGVIGCSVAWHLSQLGMREIVVLERASAAGEGSTGKATGGFRAQFGSEINIRLSMLSREKLLHFRDELGVDPSFSQVGYLFLADDERQMEQLRVANALQQSFGLSEARVIGRPEVRWYNAAVDEKTVMGGVFCPTDGTMRPLEILRGYLQGAFRMGVHFWYGAAPIAFDRDAHGAITAVETERGAIETDVVVNAAGAWAAGVAALAHLELPVVPLRRNVAPTEATSVLPSEMPMTIFGDGFHLRVRDGRVLLLRPHENEEGDHPLVVGDQWVSDIRERADRRIPALREVAIDRERCWSGYYEMSPDDHALVGALPECPNLLFVNGSSGHGVMHSPALGQLIAEVIVHGEAKSLDVRPLRPSRFRENEPVQSIPLL